MFKSPFDDSQSVTIPGTWYQRAWQRSPEWAKIGFRAFLLMSVIDIGLAIRVWCGLQEPPEVTAIRGSGRHIIIPASDFDFRNPVNWFKATAIGLRGTSGRDVTTVRLDEHATDQLVVHIAKHFPNVETLYFSHGKISTQGLLVLKNCPQLQSLDVSDTDIDDGLGELLPQLPGLTTLIANNTSLGDAFAKAAEKYDALEYCSIEGTDITPVAVAEWKAKQPKLHVQTDFDRCILRGVIRWSDGETSRKFSGPFEICYDGPHSDHTDIAPRRTTKTSAELRANDLCWSPQDFENDLDGIYQIRLKLGSVDAEPVEFRLEDGVPSPHRLEFRMPMPRAEAERAAGSDTQN